MAKKEKDEETKDKKEKDEAQEQKKEQTKSSKYEWDPSDGISYHDFVGVFLVILGFFWSIIRLILVPVFWVSGEIKRMWNFMQAGDHNRVLTDDEREFMETIPFIYTMTGLVSGVILGILGVLQFQEALADFLDNLNFELLVDFFNFLIDIIVWIVKVIITIFVYIGKFFGFIVDLIANAFSVNPFLAFGVLTLIGIVIISLWIVIVELGVLDAVYQKLTEFVIWIIGSPELLRLKVDNYYRKFNHYITMKLVGEERIHTRTQIYFKKVVTYTLLASLWSFGAGIFVGANPAAWGGFDTPLTAILFTASVLFVAGIISGTLFFAFIARFYEALNRAKYIAPEFIKDGNIDSEEIAKFTKEDEDRVIKSLEIDEEAELAKRKKAKEAKKKDKKSKE